MPMLWYNVGMTIKPCPKKRIEWWDLVLLGLIPAGLFVLSFATYQSGRNWNRLLLDAVVSSGTLVFVAGFVFALARIVQLLRAHRWTMAVSGLVLYAACASTVVLGMLYAMFGRP